MTTTRNFEIEVDSLLLCQKLPLHSNLGCFPNQKTVIQKFYQNQTKKQKKKQQQKYNNKKEAKQLDLHDFRFRYY